MPSCPPCPTAPASAHARALACAAALGLAAAAAGCAGSAPAPDALDRAEVLVEVLPRAAQLTVDGVPLGRGGRVVPVPEANHRYRFRAAAPGFAAAERSGDGAHLSGTRIALVLAPSGTGVDPLDVDDGEALAAAAEALDGRGDHPDAVDYAERAARATPKEPAKGAAVQRVVERILRAPRGIDVRR